MGFFKGFGVETADAAEFKAEIRKNMERELARALRNVTKQQVINGLVASNEVDVPASLIDQEIDRLRQQAVQQFGGGQQLDPSQQGETTDTQKNKHSENHGEQYGATTEKGRK